MTPTPHHAPTQRHLWVVALATVLALAAASAASAQGSGGDRGVLELAERFIDPWRDPQTSRLLLLEGEVPEAVPALPAFAAGQLLGSLTRFEQDGPVTSTLLYDFSVSQDEAFVTVQNELRADGWRVRVDDGALGFLGSDQFLYGYACKPGAEAGQGWVAFFNASRGMDPHPTQLRVELNPFYDPGICEPFVEPWRAGQVPLPVLAAPAGAQVSSTMWSQTDLEATTSAVLRGGDRNLNQVMSFYAGQLGAAGWRPLGAAAVPHVNGSASRWRYQDEHGSWIGLLSVGRTVEAGEQAVVAPFALSFVVVPSP